MAVTVLMTKPEGTPGIKSLICDATISISPTFSNIITQHAVEKSANITDHAYNRNPVIKVEGVISNHHIFEYEGSAITTDGDRVLEAYNLLKGWWKDRTRVTIVSHWESYEPCIVEQFSTNFSKESSEALVFTLVLQQLRTAEAQEGFVTNVAQGLVDDAAETTSGNDVKEEAKPDTWENLPFRTPPALNAAVTGPGGGD